ncbi:hypothetical protein ONZ45_g11250 [Pleurotus djamor]|nr:hypothetical protein ONZ45_g11250 [Pleurotus djamor]
MAFASPYVNDLPHLVDPGPSQGYIPPPNEPGIHSAFPGFSSPAPGGWGQPQGAWASPGSPQWGAPAQNQFGGGGFSNSYFEQPITATPYFGGASPMARSNSLGGSSPYHGLKRTHSLGSTHSPSPWRFISGPTSHRDDAYNEHNLARRPRDWRADYTPRPGVFVGVLQKFLKVDTEVKEITDKVRRKIHPLLNYSLTTNGMPPIYVHVLNPSHISLPAAGRAPNQLDFCQLACDPPADFLRIMHPALPWYIDIQNTQPNGITIGDILMQMAEALNKPISARHFWNEALTSGDRAALTTIFKERTGEDMMAIRDGVKQVDFLGGAVWLMGFVRRSGGMWEMVTERSANR